MREAVEGKAARAGQISGWLRRPQLWKAFTEHDVLVMPSTIREAMGRVALAAQACGLPSSTNPCTTDWLRDRRTLSAPRAAQTLSRRMSPRGVVAVSDRRQ
ncbi:hypothetical protein Scani_67780 [Streptomyces caniferus]|uniref:Glycosyl transferase family 1 domain-containing protein n=1 Tax=Streptomyces caniferus TaxID=285557 RepID=A0A640SHN0_9ACTN|nr:hypothetical protein Scani_67780 [Streptomyces caniferus]